MNQFKVGDFVFNEFELKQVEEMEHGNVIGVTCGFFKSMSNNIKCYPLNIRINTWNRVFREIYDDLHKVKHVNLNYPDIKRYLVSKWEQVCDLILIEKYDDLKSIETDIYNFRDGMKSKENHGLGDYWMGVRVLRQTE